MSAELEHFLHVRLKDGVRIMQQSEFLQHGIEEGASRKKSSKQWKIYMADPEVKKSVRCFSGGGYTWGAPLPHSEFGSVDNNELKKRKEDAEAQKLNHSSDSSSSSS